MNYKFKIQKNSQDIYRVVLMAGTVTRFLRDEDLLFAIPSSYTSSVIEFKNKEGCEIAIKKFLNLRDLLFAKHPVSQTTPQPTLEDFEDLKDQ